MKRQTSSFKRQVQLWDGIDGKEIMTFTKVTSRYVLLVIVSLLAW
jgi:hypothetical protein